MVIKNLRQLFFEFVKIVVAKQHPTDPLSRSIVLLHIIIPPITPLTTHVVEVFFSTHEVIEDIFVPYEFKSCHGI